jgi:hypothetical protein
VSESYSKVWIVNNLSYTFHTQSGLQHGFALCPLIFSLALEYAIGRSSLTGRDWNWRGYISVWSVQMMVIWWVNVIARIQTEWIGSRYTLDCYSGDPWVKFQPGISTFIVIHLFPGKCHSSTSGHNHFHILSYSSVLPFRSIQSLIYWWHWKITYQDAWQNHSVHIANKLFEYMSEFRYLEIILTDQDHIHRVGIYQTQGLLVTIQSRSFCVKNCYLQL